MNPAHTTRESTVRILIADADADTRGLYRESLRATGCDVIDAADGREALVSALTHRPSLVITETRLPIFDGFQLCELLRRDWQTSSVPILVLTADVRKSEVDRARKAGADSVLIKPVTPEALLVEVERLIGEPSTKPDAKNETAPSPFAAQGRRQAKAQHRIETTNPPVRPPHLVCPSCDRSLNYERSHIGGVRSRQEQWDSFICPASCGRFEYRQRTRQLRKVS
jgi:CheY-like chemotaxis protein